MTIERSLYSGRPIIDWKVPYTLHDVHGDKIGAVVEVNPDFLIVQSGGGFLGLGEHRTYYVPRTHITREEGTDWYLSIDQDDIEDAGWTAAPTSSPFAPDEWQTEYGYGAEARAATAPGHMRMIRFQEDLEAQTVEVPLRHEEVHVERRPVSDATVAAYQAGDTAFRETEQEIRVRDETRRVSDTVRKERFDVEDTSERATDAKLGEDIR